MTDHRLRAPWLWGLFLGALVALPSTDARADEHGFPPQAEDDALEYFAEGIPLPVRFRENDACHFSDLELGLIRQAFLFLPEPYWALGETTRIEKNCKRKAKASELRSGIIFLGEAAFTDNEGRVLRTIAHELTHALDDLARLSSNRAFRQINHWTRSWTFRLKPDTARAEGFYAESRGTPGRNPREDLAASAEGYFFDEKFICEHPAMYAWFSSHVGPSALAPSECPELQQPLDPASIRAVGYMLISATSSKVESRFGHALLHFHDFDNDPLNDIVIQGAGNYPGQPLLSGFESTEEIEEKSDKVLEISRLDLLLKGATGGLDFVVQPMRYQMKWLETLVIEGRDIREKVLDLSPLQLRLMAYIVNRDIQRDNVHYRFFKYNCATYVGETLNKALAAVVVKPGWSGIYTPNRIYSDVDAITAHELPLAEGDLSRLRRLLPKRLKLIDDLRKDRAFKKVRFSDFKKIKNTESGTQKAIAALDTLVETCIRLADSDQLLTPQKKIIQSLIYTYVFETDIRLKRHAMDAYKRVIRL